MASTDTQMRWDFQSLERIANNHEYAQAEAKRTEPEAAEKD